MPPFADPPDRPAVPVRSDFAYVRKVKGRKWQARPWVGGTGHVNLGLFDTDADAARAVRLWLAGTLTPPPRWSRLTPAGWVGERVRGVVLAGPFPTAAEAHAAVATLVAGGPTEAACKRLRRRRRNARQTPDPTATTCPTGP